MAMKLSSLERCMTLMKLYYLDSQDSSIEKEKELSYYDSNDGSDGIEVIVEKAYHTNIWKLTDMDIHPRNIKNNKCDTLALKKNEADWLVADGYNPNKE